MTIPSTITTGMVGVGKSFYNQMMIEKLLTENPNMKIIQSDMPRETNPNHVKIRFHQLINSVKGAGVLLIDDFDIPLLRKFKRPKYDTKMLRGWAKKKR